MRTFFIGRVPYTSLVHMSHRHVSETLSSFVPENTKVSDPLIKSWRQRELVYLPLNFCPICLFSLVSLERGNGYIRLLGDKTEYI